jgi:two-component sensor histidine kinase
VIRTQPQESIIVPTFPARHWQGVRVMEERAMEQGNSESASVSVLKDQAGGTQQARDLRLEVLDLRLRLKLSEEALARHTVMLREGDHRIKNSLQLVASLMRLQACSEATRDARDALNAAAARVGSVASIHDALQENAGDGFVDLGQALRTACDSLQTMAGDAGKIDIAAEIEMLKVPAAQARPLVLVVNELVVNALRHAFTGRDAGTIRISLSHDDTHLRITVTDDGVGLPADYANGHGYGMRLVNMLIRQAGAVLQIDRLAGTRFTIRVPFDTKLHP